MQGTWSMVFRGRREELEKVLAGAESLRDDPRCGRFCKTFKKEGRQLRAEGTWKHAILGLTETLEALHQFAPKTEAACRTMIEEYCYIDYLAPREAKSSFTELRRLEEGGWTAEEGDTYVLHMWEDW